MYCFRCGQKLPSGVVTCPVCDTIQKRRQRYRQRLFLGLFIFLAGAFVGSLFDSLLFQGRTWQHSIFNQFRTGDSQPSSAETSSDRKPVDNADLQSFSETSEPTPDHPLSTDVACLPEVSPVASSEIPTVAASDSQSMTIASEAESTPPTSISQDVQVEHTIPDGKLSFKSVTQIENGPGTNYHGSLSPDGKMLIFVSDREEKGMNKKFQCYVRDVTAQGPSAKLFPWEGNIWTPEFSSDGNSLVFSSDSAKPEHIFVYDRISQRVHQLTEGKSKNMMPSFSPDGKYIVFTSNRKGTNDIWMIGVDGENLIQITSSRSDDREPRWWPDGRAIAFTRIIEKFKISSIMKVPLDPQGPPETVVGGTNRNWLADPSPDGRYLAYVRSMKDGGSGNVIRILRIDSGDEFVLEPFKGSEHYRPIWTHDCNGLIFHAEKSRKRDLFKIDFQRTPFD